MTRPPEELDRRRTVLATVTIDHSDGWWTGIVYYRDEETKEKCYRLERLVENDGDWDAPHVWRIRPSFWNAERAAVDAVEGGMLADDEVPANLPLDQRLTPRSYYCVRKDEKRWVAVVEVDQPYKSRKTRLYHWSPEGRTRQKWTVGKHWSQIRDVTTRLLENDQSTEVPSA